MAIAANEQALASDVLALMPSGLIAMWHGTIANIPPGFVICDGNNSTPNLLAKFVEGVATAATDPGATGGAATHALSVAETPAHTHQVQSGTGSNDAGGYLQRGLNASIMMTSTSIGSGNAHENKPPFYDVAFIMKT